MKVKDVMTAEPITAEVPGRREEVLRLLASHHISGLPVVEAGTTKLVGVITRSDVFRNPEEQQTAMIMSSDPHTIGPEDELSEAAFLLVSHEVHGLPVINRQRYLKGVISPTDVLKVLQEGYDDPIGDLVHGHVAPAHTSTPLPVVWATMNLIGANALPVLDDDARLCGIVADSDLFKSSEIDESKAVTVLGLGSDRSDWSAAAFRSLMPLYYATARVDLPVQPVRDIMTENVATAVPQTTIAEAATKMLKFKVQQLPVVDADDRLLGVITDLDLLRVLFDPEREPPEEPEATRQGAGTEAIVETQRRQRPTVTTEITIPELPKREEPEEEEPEPEPEPKAAPAKAPAKKEPAKAAPTPKPEAKAKAAPKKKAASTAKPKVYHVSTDANGGWKVKAEGNKNPSGKFDTKAEAVDRARELAQNQKGRLIIHKTDGKVQKAYRYDE